MSEQGKLRAMEQQIQDQQRLAWAMLIVGVAAGLLGMHFIVARPMNNELATLKQSLQVVRSQVDTLTQESVDSGYTTSLLSELKAQREHLTAAKVALRQWNDLNESLLAETRRSTEASQSMASLQSLTEELVSLRPTTEEAQASLAQVNRLQVDMVKLGEETPAAESILKQYELFQGEILAQREELDAAGKIAARQHELQRSIMAQSEALASAQGIVGNVARLSTTLIDAASQIDVAQRMSETLIQLEETLASRPVDAETSLREASQLVAVSKTLHEMDHLTGAEANVRRADQLAKDLAGRTKSLADAAENLELIVEFQNEIGVQIRGLNGLREQFFQLAMLEKSIGEAMKVLQPLFDLTNLKRLSDEDLRTAARSILRQRTSDEQTRLAGESREPLHGVTISTGAGEKLGGTANETLVPQPLD